MHPDGMIKEEAGDLSVQWKPDAGSAPTGSPLFHVPGELLIPIDGAVWSDRVDALELVEAPPNLTPAQRDLLDLHVALYNALGKVPWARGHQPDIALRPDEPLLRAIRAIRPQLAWVDEPVGAAFISTRTLGVKPRGPDGLADPSLVERSVLMPLIDAMNHHPRGARLSLSATGMEVGAWRPTGSSECFANYGPRKDVLGLALHYGFLEPEPIRARSAPIDIEVADVGRVSVLATSVRSQHRLGPPTVSATADGIALSHVTFDRDRPEGFGVVVGMTVRSMALRQGIPPRRAQGAAHEATGKLAAGNLVLLKRLAESASGASKGHAAELVRQAAQLQAGVVRHAAGIEGDAR